MDIMKLLKRNLLYLFLAIIFAAGFTLFMKYASRTKIGVINFPEYMYVKMAKSNDSHFIKLNFLQPDSLPNLSSYDMLIIWGHGMRIPEDQETKIVEARDKGVPILLYNASNPRLQLTTLVGEQLDKVSDYIDNGGTGNYRNMVNYIRREINGKIFFTGSYSEPKKYSSEALFYTDEEAIFDSIPDFEKYCLEKGLHNAGAERVVLFTSVPGPFNANRDHLNSLIDEIHSRGYNVYPMAGMTGRIDFIKKVNPALVVYMPHGRLNMAAGDPCIEALKKLNIPVICPLSVHKKYDEWVKNKMGMVGGMLGQSITMPELDGGIVSYAVVAQYEDERGYLVFRAIPERLKAFGDIVRNCISLKHKPNKDKKIAIVYYKGHGKNALEAAGLEVLPSLFNVLKRLKAEGYTVENLPADEKTFAAEIMLKGPVFGPYAEGAFDKYLKSGYAELIPVRTYKNWCTQAFPKELYAEVESRYGKAPGSYMAVSRDTDEFMAVTRVQYGNVVLLPQPLPGLGDNAFELVHGANVAPPHSYIAPYMWIQKGFKADAVMHFGTHGSLEFTPGKQVALSQYDWADRLIGTIPHFYVYTISDPGEAMIAKRRSYAVTVSHLTPPFIESLLLNNKKIIRDKLAKYESATGSLRHEYSIAVKLLAIKEGYNKDLGIDNNPNTPLNEVQMLRLTNYLDELDNEKITAGLYTMGNAYTTDKIDATVMIMSADAVAYSQANLDRMKGLVTDKQIGDKALFNLRYIVPAKQKARDVIRTGNSQAAFNQMVNNADFTRALRWKAHQQVSSKPGMGHKMSKDITPGAVDDKKLEQWVINVASQPEKKEFILKFKSKNEFERAYSLLDPANLARAKSIAKMIPAMKKSIEIAEDSTVLSLIAAMNDSVVRQKVLKMVEDQSLAERIKQEKIHADKLLLTKAVADSNLLVFSCNAETADVYELQQIAKRAGFYSDSQKVLLQLLPNSNEAKAKQLLADLSSKTFEQKVGSINKNLVKKETFETDFAEAVFAIKDALDNIVSNKKMLQTSPDGELSSIVNAFGGGYLAPSPGGDPIANPLTLPTGRNLVSVNAEVTPTKEAWSVGRKLGEAMLADYMAKHGKLPKKVSYTLWSSEFIETEGATIAQVLFMLGVEPVWDAYGRVQDIRLIPARELGRPRIDVVVQTSGQLRDLAASRLFLINRAIAMASTDKESDENYVREGVADAKKRLLENGYSPKQAEELSKARVFGGVNGDYGTNIMGMVEKGDSWDSTATIARTYLDNMSAVYGSEAEWGAHNKGVFEAALLNTEVVVQPRQSNTWGALSLDHVYEFMGGLNLAVKQVTGKDAESYMSDYRNPSSPRMQGLKDAIWVESRTTLLNPRYIKEYMKGGSSAAETFAETFRNTYAWNVMKPSAIDSRLWEELYDTYVKDKQNLGVHKFFEAQNPYALQEMTAVMLETVRKGMWKATPEQVRTMAQLHTQLVSTHDAGCSGFVCDNDKLRKMITEQVSPEEARKYTDKIAEAREAGGKEGTKSKVLTKEHKEKINTTQHDNSPVQTGKWVMVAVVFILLSGFLLFVRNRK